MRQIVIAAGIVALLVAAIVGRSWQASPRNVLLM